MKTSLKTLVIAFMLVCANVCAVAAPPLSIVQKAKAMVEDARYQLPVEMGNGLTLYQLSYNSGTYSLVYRYYYSMEVTKPSSEAIKETKLGLIHLLKANPNSQDMMYLKNGITFHYNYYNPDGTFVYAMKITPADIK